MLQKRIEGLIKRFPWLCRQILVFYHRRKNSQVLMFDARGTYIAKRCTFEGRNIICRGVTYCGTMGYGSYIGNDTHLVADIGRFSSIGPRCRYIYETHPYKEPFVSTSRLFVSMPSVSGGKTFTKREVFEEFRFYDKEHGIVNKIGNDCWLGADVTLIGGVEIHDGAVVLSHAVVTHDVPPYAIVGGIPAKIIGYRYDEETIQFLQKTKWWNNGEEWFEENWELMVDMNKFKKYYCNLEASLSASSISKDCDS